MADEFIIEEAERSSGWLRIALAGASNSGKTWSGLLLAKGIMDALREAGVAPGPIDGKIGVICTERGSAKLYAHLVPFGVITLVAPYSPERYIKAIRQMAAAGRKLIMVDQISHCWSGSGGVLEMAAAAGRKEGGGGSIFGHVSDIQNKFIENILATPAHLILTMRSKTEWEKESYVDRKGVNRTKPKRIGMEPVQRKGSEYEWTTLMNLDTDSHLATVLKDRTQVLRRDEPFVITEQIGQQFVEWLLSGKPMEAEEDELSGTEKAQAICEAAEQLMDNAQTIPDRGRIFHQHKNMLMELLGELNETEVNSFRGILRAAYDRQVSAKPDLGGKGVSGDFLNPWDMEQIEVLLAKAHIPVHEVLGEFEVHRLTLIPSGRYEDVVGWIIGMAGRNGMEIARPERVVPPVEPDKITAQTLIDERMAKAGKSGLFAKDNL